MPNVLTLDEWNDILEDINSLATDPDEGCDELDPLDLVTSPHKWSVSDIEDARDKLMDICDENEFNAPTDKWNQDIIDELLEAIDNGWCGCEGGVICTPEYIAALAALEGNAVRTFNVHSADGLTIDITEQGGPPFDPLAQYVPSNFTGITWDLEVEWTLLNTAGPPPGTTFMTTVATSGTFGCDGKLSGYPTFPINYSPPGVDGSTTFVVSTTIARIRTHVSGAVCVEECP